MVPSGGVQDRCGSLPSGSGRCWRAREASRRSDLVATAFERMHGSVRSATIVGAEDQPRRGAVRLLGRQMGVRIVGRRAQMPEHSKTAAEAGVSVVCSVARSVCSVVLETHRRRRRRRRTTTTTNNKTKVCWLLGPYGQARSGSVSADSGISAEHGGVQIRTHEG